VAKARSLVGLDVHATKIVAAVLNAETGELQFFTLGGEIGQCAVLPKPRPNVKHQPRQNVRRQPRLDSVRVLADSAVM
jgi:hypothetical protein